MQDFRPSNVQELLGQDHLLPTIQAWTADPKKIPQSLLLSGPFGCGKTSIARILASALTTGKLDIHEENMAASRGIDDVRDLIGKVRFNSLTGARIFILDELHQMTEAAQVALLKVVEEPPKGIYFFLCTTNSDKLIPMLRSRCVKIEVRLLNRESTDRLIQKVYPEFPAEGYPYIFEQSQGHARVAVKLLSYYQSGGTAALSQIQKERDEAKLNLQVLFKEMQGGNLTCVNQYFRGSDPRDLVVELDNYFDREYTPSDEYLRLMQLRVWRKSYLLNEAEYLKAALSILLTRKV